MHAVRLKKMWWLFVLLIIGAGASLYLAFQGNGKEATEEVMPIPKKSMYKVGILQCDSLPEQDRMRAGFVDALASQGYAEGKSIQFTVVNGNGKTAAIEKGAHDLIRGKQDLVAAISNDAGMALAGAAKATPVIGIGILNFRGEEWLDGHDNFAGMTSLPNVITQISTAKRLVSLDQLGILYTKDDPESMQQLSWLRTAAQRKNLKLYEVAVAPGEKPSEKAALFKGHANAVYIAEDEGVLKDFDSVVKTLTSLGIPIIGADDNMVRRGALISVSEDYYRMGFSAGLMAAKLLEGEIVPADLGIKKQKDNDLVINMAAAKTLHIKLPNDLWQRARKLYLYTGQPARP